MDISIITKPTPAFADLVQTHVDYCNATAPPESCHNLPLDALFVDGITVWSAELDGALVGMGALKALPGIGGEVKSMHTRSKARGTGVARALLATIIAEARARKYPALWLETGAGPQFEAARALYAAHGFTVCAPFADYKLDPLSTFMACELAAVEAIQ